jgi:transglutaminase-like putative cysteine protease
MKRFAAFFARLPRDKADTLLLLLAAVMVLAPHASHLPPWISAGVVATLMWRTALTLSGRRLPPLWLLAPVSVAAMGGVWLSFHTLLGRDAGVAMLALLLAFKLLEMHARRDLFVVIFLSFFLLLTNFFYSQSIATAALMLLTIVLLLTAQLSFQYTGAVPSLGRRLRLGGLIVALAAPLATLLFVGFPRIQGPLWGLPGDARGGHTGMSDSMSPGALSNLAQSDEIAFRAHFTGAVPAQPKLYWRGIVLGNYDGRTWTRNYASQPRPRRAAAPQRPEQNLGHQEQEGGINIDLLGAAVRYQVTLEPSNGHWIYALDLPERLRREYDNPTVITPELEFISRNPMTERVRYEVSSVLDYRFQADASEGQLRQWLELPSGFNPRTLALAKSLQRPGDPAAGVRAVLNMFHQQNYSYTLQPPLLGRDAVDDFLFDSKAGFCEHYAGAFVVLMRAMGIPARVVTGYQGGEINPVDGYLTVRQSDAHAWGEVWLAGRGWVRIDPTAAVAPERVEKNLARALPAPSPFGLQGLGALMNFDGGPGGALLARLRFNWNAVNNSWNQWVLDYNPERQRGALQRLGEWLDNPSAWAGAGAIGLLIWLFVRLRRGRGGDQVEALYAAFCRQQARRGLVRAADEGPQTYAARLAAAGAAAEKTTAMLRFVALYAAVTYGNSAATDRPAAARELRRLYNLTK